MLKKYTANSCIAINVNVNGVQRHISFSAVTLGGSVFYTRDEKVQEALEQHYRYGELFVGEEQKEPEKKEDNVSASDEEDNKLRVIEVNCIDDAKDYLCEHFEDCSRTKLRGVEAIKETAAKHNIQFSGEDFK